MDRLKFLSLLAISTLGAAAVVATSSAQTAQQNQTNAAKDPAAKDPAAKDPAVERARREVRLLDDIYKTSIVLITTHYVDGKDSLPAGSAFKALFETVAKKGWHEVRLLDATGDPYEPNNEPKEGFEKRAIAKAA